jgi:acetyl esterase/lipase
VTTSHATPLWPDGLIDATPAPQLTPYLVDNPRGAIVVCPGGGYDHLAAHEREPIARWLNSLGIAAFVLDYRIAPNRHPAPLSDGQRAVQMVRHHAATWGLDPARLGMLGFSAGGHLAASVATQPDAADPASADPVARQSSRPDAIVIAYAVISLIDFHHQRANNNLFGPDATLAQRELLSAERHVDPQTPPAFIWHTADDEKVPVEHSLIFASALRRHGVPFALHVYPHGRHGLALAQNDPIVGSWRTLCAAWLADRGYGHGATGTN